MTAKTYELLIKSIEAFKASGNKQSLIDAVKRELDKHRRAMQAIGMGFSEDYVKAGEIFLRLITLYKLMKGQPNGSAEDIKLGILHSRGGWYVSNEGGKLKPNYHVWVPGVTHATCDSTYADLSYAVARCDYLAAKGVRF